MNYQKIVKCLGSSNFNTLYNLTSKLLKNTRFSSTTNYGDINSTTSGNYENDNNSLLLLQNNLQNRMKPFTVTEWKRIRSDLITKQKFINEVNVDATILSLCNSSNHLDIAKSYISFLKSEGFELNNASIGRLMKVYYLVYKAGQITEDDKKDIIDIYEMILKRYKILDSTTCENLIHGIIATDKWKNSLDLLNMIELTCKPSVHAYSTIITKAFDPIDGDEDIAWKLLKEMVANNKQPKCEIFLMYLKRCSMNKKTFEQNIEKILQFIEKNEIFISKMVVNELQLELEQFGINSSITTLTRNGQCNSCRLKLKNISLSSEEFNKLSSTFLNKVLIRKDVFLKSLPEEVDSFKKFIDDKAPFDCVVDGLNVAFSTGRQKNPAVYAKLLSSAIKYFVQRKKKVLVIGREHMKKWPKEQMMYIKRNSSFFFTKNLSHDDPFLLYAALKSGPNTDFISRDLMRSHAFLLGHDLKPIFRRWQIEHQYMVLRVNENGEAVIKEPVRHYLTAHKINSTWHVPFREVYVTNPADEFEIPANWLCISSQNKNIVV